MTEIEQMVTRIEAACSSCRATREAEGQDLRNLERVVYGHDSSSGLKGIVNSLSQKMSLIQWVIAIITVAVVSAVADRILNKPATNASLEMVNQTIQDASDKAAKSAAKAAVELLKNENKNGG